MTPRRRARLKVHVTPNGPMWDAFDITTHFDTRCSRNVPSYPPKGNGLLDKLLRMLKHTDLLDDPSEVRRDNGELYLGPRAASELVSQIVATQGTSAKARALQEKFAEHVTAPDPSECAADFPSSEVSGAGVIVLPSGNVYHTHLNGEVWVHLESLTDALEGTGLHAAITDHSAVREFVYLGETSAWVSLDTAVVIAMASHSTPSQSIIYDVLSRMSTMSAEESETSPASESTVETEDDPSAPEARDHGGVKVVSHDDVKVVSVRAYIATVSPDPSVRKVYGLIIRNPGITRQELHSRLTSGVRKKLDDILAWLITKAGAAYNDGSHIYPILEHDGIRAAA